MCHVCWQGPAKHMIADGNKLTLVPVRHSADHEVAGFVDELLGCAAPATLYALHFFYALSRLYRL